MKKKNLIVLLMIPFLIALLGIGTLTSSPIFIDNDIIGIKWDYNDVEGFRLRDNLYELKAEVVKQKDYPLSYGNALVWTVKNLDNETIEKAEIIQKGAKFFLKTKVCGEVIITCSNEKGNIFKSMNAVIYEDAAILVNTIVKGSQKNIDKSIYYGEYDLVNDEKVNATIDLNVRVVPETMEKSLIVKDISDNIESFDLSTGKIKIKKDYLTKNEEAFIKFSFMNEDAGSPYTFKFNLVKDGVNCYNYDDLLYCTNRSEHGEICVLRKSFESLDNLENSDLNNTELFGHYDNGTFSFTTTKGEIYKFKTTFNSEFIKQWNEAILKKGSKNTISDDIIVGLRVQKDFYGNGYTINLHNLAYPSKVETQIAPNGEELKLARLSDSDLFRGPLPFYALGDHNNSPLVEAFGQDNIGMYVEGNDILINDLNLKNCDFGNLFVNLDTTGTVLETSGNNITIRNCALSNGKNVLRTFSSMNVLLDNSILSNGRNFLLEVGTNEYIPVKEFENELNEFVSTTNETIKESIKNYLVKDAMGDVILNSYLTGETLDPLQVKNSLLSIQNALNNVSLVENIYKGTITVNDTIFYQSGIASIALESLFNGPFLYNNVPSIIQMVLGLLQTQDGMTLGEIVTSKMSGISYPAKVTLKGKTQFYDYKDTKKMDISGLINENISEFASSIAPDYSGEISIDKIFPIKDKLFSKAPLYNRDDNSYISVPIAFYGGGTNLSQVVLENEDKIHFTNPIEIDFLDSYLNLPPAEITSVAGIKNIMLKSVTVVTGFEPFHFICLDGSGYLFDETPNVSQLIENAKGGLL